MPTLKLGDVATTFAFNGDAYVDKLSGRDTFLVDSDPSAIKLQIDLARYSRRKQNNLEDSDFARLQQEIHQLSKLSIRDATVAKAIKDFPNVSLVEVDIGAGEPLRFTVKTQTADHREVAFEF